MENVQRNSINKNILYKLHHLSNSPNLINISLLLEEVDALPNSPGGGCTKASVACGNLTPYLCYGALSGGDRTQEIFQMHKTKFSLRTVTFWRNGAKSSGPIKSLVTN